MYDRKVKSRNSVCFQIGKKQSGRFQLIKHVGCTPVTSEEKIQLLRLKAQADLTELVFKDQLSLFPNLSQKPKAKLLDWKITGYRKVFGSVYDQIGFPNNLLRDLVVARIVYPKSKLATIRYMERYLGIKIFKDKLYRFLDTLDKKELTNTAFDFVTHKGHGVSIIFYDVTTLHFTNKQEDNLRKKGYSKIHRHDLPQILVGLFVDRNGYPFDFDFFRGNTFEGHTFQQVVDDLVEKYHFEDLTVVADAAMLSSDNLSYLSARGLNYIVGARLKNLSAEVTDKFLAHDFANVSICEIKLKGKKLFVAFSEKRSKRDKSRRKRQIEKLKGSLASGKQVVRKSKYLLMEGKGKAVGINQEKVEYDQRFDGLKGYFVNSANQMEPAEIIRQYRNL